jgi:hypothetical protein
MVLVLVLDQVRGRIEYENEYRLTPEYEYENAGKLDFQARASRLDFGG